MHHFHPQNNNKNMGTSTASFHIPPHWRENPLPGLPAAFSRSTPPLFQNVDTRPCQQANDTARLSECPWQKRRLGRGEL